MPAKKEKKGTVFAMALAARRGDIPPESLTGAAKRLYHDKTLTQEQLRDYVKKKQSSPAKTLSRRYQTFKRA